MAVESRRVLTLREAKARTKQAVDKLEEINNRFDGTPGRRDRKRREGIAKAYTFMLMREYAIKTN